MKAILATSAAYATISASGASAAITRQTGSQLGTQLLLAIVATGVTTGATFNIEGRRSTRDGNTPYQVLNTFSITANGTYAVPVETDLDAIGTAPLYEQYRVNTTSFTDGSYVVTKQTITGKVG